jgi:hypothetical protein
MTPYRQGEGFREEAKGVLRRLGSRDRQRTRRGQAGRATPARRAGRTIAPEQISFGFDDAASIDAAP